VKASERKVFSVLFLCTGNSARSILAEAILNHALGRGRFRAFSAGSHPKSEPNPYAIQLLTERRIPVEGLRSKSWDEFAKPDSPPLDFVITVCDQAAGEQCPFWPGQPISAHWCLPDPAEVEGSDEAKRKAFAETFMTLRRRIELFTSLPMSSLDRIAIQERAREIGKQ
jgi:arsenate reductase